MSLFGPPNISTLKQRRDTQRLIKALNYNKDTWIRAEAAKALGELQAEDAIQPLSICLHGDIDEHVRTKAAWALGQFKNKATVDFFIQALHDHYWAVRKEAILALESIGDKRAIEPLIETLLSNYDNLMMIRADIFHALGAFGDQRAVDPIVNNITVNIGNLLSKDIKEAVIALGKLGNKKATMPLIDLLKQNVFHGAGIGSSIDTFCTKTDVIKSLGQIKDERAIGVLVPYLSRSTAAIDRPIESGHPEAALTALVNIGAAALEPSINLIREEQRRLETFKKTQSWRVDEQEELINRIHRAINKIAGHYVDIKK